MSPLGLQRGTVRLEEYNPEWRDLFEQEKELLLKTFGSRILKIEHIGSTAIPGLPAKPIIDINVAIPSLDDINDFIVGLHYAFIASIIILIISLIFSFKTNKKSHHLHKH